MNSYPSFVAILQTAKIELLISCLFISVGDAVA